MFPNGTFLYQLMPDAYRVFVYSKLVLYSVYM